MNLTESGRIPLTGNRADPGEPEFSSDVVILDVTVEVERGGYVALPQAGKGAGL